jgi:toxin-antitoxin system PIN domain toxin
VTPDVNVLVAAFRPDHAHHAIALDWLSQARRACATGRGTLALLPTVVVGFLRLVTHPRVFVDPDPVEDGVAFIDALLATPGVEFLPTGTEWIVLRQKLLTLALHGNALTDAWIASSTQAASEHLVTFDHHFARLLPPRDLTLLGTT